MTITHKNEKKKKNENVRILDIDFYWIFSVKYVAVSLHTDWSFLGGNNFKYFSGEMRYVFLLLLLSFFPFFLSDSSHQNAYTHAVPYVQMTTFTSSDIVYDFYLCRQYIVSVNRLFILTTNLVRYVGSLVVWL